VFLLKWEAGKICEGQRISTVESIVPARDQGWKVTLTTELHRYCEAAGLRIELGWFRQKRFVGSSRIKSNQIR
jgi:hypothetical protein